VEETKEEGDVLHNWDGFMMTRYPHPEARADAKGDVRRAAAAAARAAAEAQASVRRAIKHASEAADKAHSDADAAGNVSAGDNETLNPVAGATKEAELLVHATTTHV
jgi:hypothetical protein